jgi:hypothetical protein
MREILIRARELIADPANWCQEVYSFDGPLPHPDTRCFCTLGAINRAVLEKHQKIGVFEYDDDAISFAEGTPEATAARRHLRKILDGCSVAEFNDEHDHEEVIALLDQAIAA